MNIGNLFKIAVKALGNNKFRGFLTMLGIIIGVAAVITMLAIGQGSKRSIQASVRGPSGVFRRRSARWVPI